MSTICLGMLLGLPHSEMAGWGYLQTPPTIITIGQKQQLSVDGRTGQSGAHRTSTVHCPVPYHVSRPLGSVAIGRWIRQLPRLSDAHRTVWCYSPRAPIVGLSAQTGRCPTRQSSAHQTDYGSLAGAPLVRRLTVLFIDFSLFLWASFVLESWTSMLLL
jgi:hypothetical protein